MKYDIFVKKIAMKKYVVSLSKEELMLLDGKCSKRIQNVINIAKGEEERYKYVLNFVTEQNPYLQKITHCVVCDDSINKLDSHKIKKNPRYYIQGYFLGRDNKGKPMIVCKDCYEKYFKK